MTHDHSFKIPTKVLPVQEINLKLFIFTQIMQNAMVLNLGHASNSSSTACIVLSHRDMHLNKHNSFHIFNPLKCRCQIVTFKSVQCHRGLTYIFNF